jgi:hypothetical protein
MLEYPIVRIIWSRLFRRIIIYVEQITWFINMVTADILNDEFTPRLQLPPLAAQTTLL